MAGFPTRTSRTDLGPTLEDERSVQNEKREISASRFNAAWWNITGMSQVSPKALIRATLSSTTVTNQFQSLAFDPNASVSPITFTYENVGHISFSFSSQYPDETGTDINLSIEGGYAELDSSVEYTGAHTGSDGQAVLTDSAQAWTVNALAGKYVYNLTDGSQGAIVSNTADTITATLAGGTDDDWDTDDGYIVIPDVSHAIVSMDNGYEGNIYFFNVGRELVDPAGFTLVLY